MQAPLLWSVTELHATAHGATNTSTLCTTHEKTYNWFVSAHAQHEVDPCVFSWTTCCALRRKHATLVDYVSRSGCQFQNTLR
ncbi:hypothetical protein FHG87_005601 [Trinorchestia longiramus]|nr:hypothetical protein FHG87_005601 [Trinorchestia longiramus]